jgi:hypothetical protein
MPWGRRRSAQHASVGAYVYFEEEPGPTVGCPFAHARRGPAHRGQHRQSCRSCPLNAADLNVVVGAVDAGVLMRAMMLWLLLHYQRILGLRNARGYCARKWMSS